MADWTEMRREWVNWKIFLKCPECKLEGKMSKTLQERLRDTEDRQPLTVQFDIIW